MDGGPGRRTSSLEQLQMLVEFATANRDLALGRLRSKEARALSARLWRDCAENLNSEGPARLPKEWAKVWNDMKSRVRSKLMSLNHSQRGTGGGPSTNVTLTPLEERVADIIGRDIGPIPNVAQNQLRQASPEEDLQEEVGIHEEQIESIEVEYVENNQLQLDLEQPGPSRRPSSPRPSSRPSPRPSSPLSLSSTPRRRREAAGTAGRSERPRLRARARNRESRVGQANTNRGALDESRNMMVRIEELRARTDHMLAESALRQAEAFKMQAEAASVSAEANRLRAQTLDKFCQGLCSLVPAARLYLLTPKSRQTRSASF